MKDKSKELDVDFIGGQEPLTKEEERKISEYLKTQKQTKKKQIRTAKSSSKKKIKV